MECITMTEQETGTTPEQPQAPEAPASETQPEQPEPKAPEVDWQQRAEAERKVNRDLEKKLNDLRDGLSKAFGFADGEKPEADTVAQQVTALQQRIDAAERKSRLLELASEHQIPRNYQHLLTATDDETLRAQAEAVAELVKGKTPGTPAPDPTQGAQPTSPEAAAQAEYERFYPPSPAR